MSQRGALAAVHQHGERVDGLAVDQDVHLHQIALAVELHVVVEAGVALRNGFQAVVEIQYHFVERQLVDQHHTVLADVFQLLLDATAVFAELEQTAHEVGTRENGGLDDGFLDARDLGQGRQSGGVIHIQFRVIREVDLIAHRGRGGDEIQIELAFEALLHDFHVQQAQESAAEAETQRLAGFGLVVERAVVQPQLVHGVAQILVVLAGGGEDARKDDRLKLLEALQHHRGRLGVVGQAVRDGVAHLHIRQLFDAGHEVAHFAHAHFVDFGHLGIEDAHLVQAVLAVAGHEMDGLAGFHGAVHDAHQADHASVRIVVAVENQRLQRRFGVAFGCGNDTDDVLQHLKAVLAGLCADVHRMGDVHQADDLIDLLQHAFGLAGRQIRLVEDGEYLQFVVQRQIGVGQGLGFDALGAVHHQDRALAGGETAAHLIGEVHMARRVDEVQRIDLAVLRGVFQRHRVGLDRDAALALQVHVIQDLGLHLTLGDGVRQLQQPIRQGRLAVIDMGDDGEIADERRIRHK